MPFVLDLLNDFEVYDGVEQVILRRLSATTAALEEFPVDSALRHQVAETEALASGGAFTSKDVVWNLPLVQVHGAPKPSDEIIEDLGEDGRVVWTMLQVDRATLDSRWRCTCRDLVLSEDLRDTIEVWSPTATNDAAGSWTPSHTPKYLGIAARIQEQGGDVLEERNLRGSRVSYLVFLGTRLVVSVNDQLRDQDGNIYEIRGWQTPDQIDQLMTLNVERVP